MTISLGKPMETTQQGARLLGYDVARALAFIGMVLVHFNLVMVASSAETHPLSRAVALLEGRAVAVFIMLAGVGLSLLSRRTRLSGDPDAIAATRRTLWKRAAFLFVCGLLFSLTWPADILRYYGLYIAFAAFFITASDRTLWLTSAALIIVSPILLLLFDYGADWNFDTITYLSLGSLGGIVRYFFFNGFHPVFPWGAFVLIGLWLGRQNVRDGLVRKRLFWGSLGVAISAESLSFFLTRLTSGDLSYLVDTVPLPPSPLYIIAASASAIAIIMLCFVLTDLFAEALWLRAFVACGQMALTLYIAHVIIGFGFFEEIGRLYNQTIYFAVAGGLAFSLLSVVFAQLWRSRYRRGPLETLMRYLT